MNANEDMLIAQAESRTLRKSKEQRQRLAYEEAERNGSTKTYPVGA